MGKTKEKIVNGVKIIKQYIESIYSIISVLSALTIFSALVIFLIGRTKYGNLCDDDLIMQRIKKQLPDNLTISDIYVTDIHGFGNDSIIVLAIADKGSEIANQFLIFDKIENDILNKFNNLYGYGSNYKLSYIFSLRNRFFLTEKYSLEIVGFIELTGDISKEIVVKFKSNPKAEGYEIGIFSYSYEKNTYNLIGTYPYSGLYEIDENNIVSTVFHEITIYQNNYFNQNETFQLDGGNEDNSAFFAESDYFGTILIRTERIWLEESAYGSNRFIISMFQPVFDADTKELKWRVLFSKKTDEYITYCSKEYVKNFLENEDSIWEISIDVNYMNNSG